MKVEPAKAVSIDTFSIGACLMLGRRHGFARERHGHRVETYSKEAGSTPVLAANNSNY